MTTHPIISFRPPNIIRQIPWQLDSKVAWGILLGLLTFTLVGWLYLSQASAVTATSYRIDELRLELDHLSNQNSALVLEIAQLESLARVQTRAKELGFQTTNNISYLPIKNYPLETLEESPTYLGMRRVDTKLNIYAVGSNSEVWWVNILDSVAAWLEK